MIGHDAPCQQCISRAVEVQHSALHKVSDLGLREVAGTEAAIQSAVDRIGPRFGRNGGDPVMH
jgi:hypothetical protein